MIFFEHFPVVVISVCLVIIACDCTSTFDIHDGTDKSEIQELKIQVKSLTSVVEHLMKDSESKEHKVNSLTSVLELFLEESKWKENRILSLENKVAELEKTINIQNEMNLQAYKTKQEKTAAYVSKQMENSNLHSTNNSSKDSHEHVPINKHNEHSGTEKTRDSTQDIGIEQHTIHKSNLTMLLFYKHPIHSVT